MSKKLELTPFAQKSSALRAHHYDPQTRELTVEFTSGTRYVYDDVPAERAEAFTGNASPGGYFAGNIRNQYKGRKL